jgi:hypothetical protein
MTEQQTQTRALEWLVAALVKSDQEFRANAKAYDWPKATRKQMEQARPLSYATLDGEVLAETYFKDHTMAEGLEELLPDWFHEAPEECEVRLVGGSWPEIIVTRSTDFGIDREMAEAAGIVWRDEEDEA